MHSYGLFASLSMIAAGLIVQRLSRRLGVDPGAALELTVAAIIGGLVGARLYWAAEHWSELRGDLAHALMGGAGFTWYGGLLGGAAAVIVVARIRRLPLGLVANMMAPAVALGYAVARIGCLLAGDGTYGRPSGLPWAMAFPNGTMPTTLRVQPTALYETLTMLVVFVVLYRMARRPQPGWHVFAWFLVLSGVERFGVEFSEGIDEGVGPEKGVALQTPEGIRTQDSRFSRAISSLVWCLLVALYLFHVPLRCIALRSVAAACVFGGRFTF
jgi:phosphatidylglycerol:prolipoprotein diacylglycerol transferase